MVAVTLRMRMIVGMALPVVMLVHLVVEVEMRRPQEIQIHRGQRVKGHGEKDEPGSGGVQAQRHDRGSPDPRARRVTGLAALQAEPDRDVHPARNRLTPLACGDEPPAAHRAQRGLVQDRRTRALATRDSDGRPSLLTSTRSTTVPSMRSRRAAAGYSGCGLSR